MPYVLGTLRRWIGRLRPRSRDAGDLTARARLELAERARDALAGVNAELLRDNAALLRDNAALARANEELIRINEGLGRSVEELTAFAGEVSHDLKGPLATVTGYVQLLGQLDLGHLRPAEYDEFLAEIGAGTDRMRWLIDDVLAYATAPGARLNLAQVDLGPLIDEVVAARTSLHRHRPGDGPAPRVTVAPLPPVHADPVLLRRVVDNLISNAIKYVHPGEPAQVRITARPAEAGWVRVEVADRGIGIPDDQHEAVFDGLHRAHPDGAYPGSGLGLAICRRIVERHGGSIGAGPEPAGGTRVWLTLPASGAAVPSSPAPSGAVVPGAVVPGAVPSGAERGFAANQNLA